jgi:hypothetical protein
LGCADTVSMWIGYPTALAPMDVTGPELRFIRTDK